MEMFYNAVKNVVAFLILVTIIMNMIGNQSYKKYVHLFTGMILILIVISPLMKLFKMDKKFDYYSMFRGLEINQTEMKKEFIAVEDSQKEQIQLEYKNLIKEQIIIMAEKEKLQIEDCKIVISEEEEQYGMVEQIFLVCRNQVDEKKKADEIIIDKIEVKNIVVKEKENIIKKTEQSIEIGKLKRSIADFYGIEEEKIGIDWKEGT